MEFNKFFSVIDRSSHTDLLSACVYTAWYEDFIDDDEFDELCSIYDLKDLW